MNKEKGILSIGMLTAITASLCCIIPVIAIVAGVSGLASTFSWLEPLRPYFIGATLLVLGFAWYQRLKPNKVKDCECEPEKQKFLQSNKFLAIVTMFAIVTIFFPAYANIFYPKAVKEVATVPERNIQTAEFMIEGMTCTSCEEHVKHEVDKLIGTISTLASYKNKNAVVQFDNSKTTIIEIERVINNTGYKVVNRKMKLHGNNN